MKPNKSDYLLVNDGVIAIGKVDFSFTFRTMLIALPPFYMNLTTTCYLTQISDGQGKYHTYAGVAVKHNSDYNDPRLARVLSLTRALIAYTNEVALAFGFSGSYLFHILGRGEDHSSVIAKRDANLKRLASKRLYERVLVEMTKQESGQ